MTLGNPLPFVFAPLRRTRGVALNDGDLERGVFQPDDINCLVFIDNRPNAGPGGNRRPLRLEEIVEELKEVGIATIARGKSTGELFGDVPNTVALLFDCGEDRTEEVEEIIVNIYNR